MSCSQFSALFKKNLIVMKRNWFSTCCLFVFPLFLFICTSLIRRALKVEEIVFEGSDYDFVKNYTSIYPVNTFPNSDLSTKNNEKELQSMFPGMNVIFPLGICELDYVEPKGKLAEKLKSFHRKSRKHIGIVKGDTELNQMVKSQLSKISKNRLQFVEFEDQDDLFKYIKSENYTIGDPELCFAYGINKTLEDNYQYILNYAAPLKEQRSKRGFYSDIPTTLFEGLSPFQTVPRQDEYRLWTTSGYIYMQNLINNAILQKNYKLNENTQIIPQITAGINAMKYPTYEYDEIERVMGFLIPFFVIIIYMIPLIVFVYRMVRDKELRLKEGMRIMGMNDLAYFFSYFTTYLIIILILAILGGAILFRSLPHVGFHLRFGMLFLFGTSVFGLIYIFQVCINRSAMAIILSIMIYFIMFFVSSAVTDEKISNGSKMAASLFPPTCLQLGFLTISIFETSRIYVTSDNINYKYLNFSINDMFIMLFVDSLLYLLIGLYLEQILPKEYGVTRPWYFLFTSKFWCGTSSNSNIPTEGNNQITDFSNLNKNNTKEIRLNFQDESNYLDNQKPENYLQLIDIHKKFDDGKKALNGVSFNLYKDEIFALLGHNGAGKSTLINIMSGLYESTSGEALYQNKNMLIDRDDFRNKIGICPQHNVLFSDLTVEEHLNLFAQFKGINSDDLDSEIDQLLSDLDMLDKKKFLSDNLSGGQKRKLCIAIALIGKSEIVFLDEPTAGMDITNRRKLWDILKKFTKDRIIILTTHYMEEASVLGKRIGIVSGGEMKCTGTPLFLINQFGKNITLNLVKNYKSDKGQKNILNNNDEADMKVVKYIEESLNKHSKSKFNYNEENINVEILTEEILLKIPKNNDKHQFNYKSFFQDLDNNLTNLNLRTYSASMPNLENVFLLISDEIKKKLKKKNEINNNDEDEKKSNRLSKDTNINGVKDDVEQKNFNNKINFDEYDHTKYTKSGTFCTGMIACLVKRYYQGIRNSKIFVLEILCPISLVLVGLALSSVEYISDPPSRELSVANYNHLQNSKISLYPLLANTINGEKLDISQSGFISYTPLITFEWDNSVNIDSASTNDNNLNGLSDNLVLFNQKIIKDYNSTKVENPTFNNTDLNKYLGAYYFIEFDNINHRYDFVSFVNMKSTDSAAIMTQEMMTNLIRYILNKDSLKIEGINSPFPLTNYQKGRTQTRNTSNLVFFAAIGFALIPASFITFLVRESNTTKHLQVISGVNYASFWIANFIFELSKYYLTGGISILIILGFDRYEDYLGVVYILYGPAFCSCTYLVSFLFINESSAQNFIILLYFVLGALAGSIIFFLRFFDSLKEIVIGLGYFLRIIPLFAWTNAYGVMLNRQTLFYIDNPDAALFKKINILSMDYVGLDITYLGFTFIIYTALLFLIEMLSRKGIGKFKPNQPNYSYINDKEVINEIKRINNNYENINKGINQNTDPESNNYTNNLSIQVVNVEKTYDTGCIGCKNHTKAVRNISFGLEYGECFAMLGVNGAGKSTMFKCLTNEEYPEKGDILINGKSISTNFEESRTSIGYCPQIDAIFEEMTVLENVEFYATIKGIPNELKESIVISIIKEMNLNEYIDKIAGRLSGGNKRKLSVAISMIANPQLILLDEPSAGMDPEARRYMWAVIHKLSKQRKKSSVILTTHSMEEAETLCQNGNYGERTIQMFRIFKYDQKYLWNCKIYLN